MSEISPVKLAKCANALAHPRRVLVLRTLLADPANGETFGRLAIATGLAETSLIHHLRVLQDCGAVQRIPRGAYSEYRLTSAQLSAALAAALRELTGPTAPSTMAHRPLAARKQPPRLAG